MNVAAISSGLSGSEDSGYADFCYYSSVNKYYTAHSSRQNTYKDLGTETGVGPWGWGDDGPDGLDQAWTRYIKYYDDIYPYEKSYSDSNITSSLVSSISGNYGPAGSSGYSYGFINGKVVKTDPETGFLYCVNKLDAGIYSYFNASQNKWISSIYQPSSGSLLPDSMLYVE